MRIISLTQGREAMVDDEDYERLTTHKWQWDKGNGEQARDNPDHIGYAGRKKTIGPPIDGKQQRKKQWMHRIIMDCPPGMVVDHKDGNGLNNQKSNLRICTLEENANNHKCHRDAQAARDLVPDLSPEYAKI